jgi:hypothetical protein
MGMGWIHDSGYQPAYLHEGYPVPIVLDGTEAEAAKDGAPEVIGWRSACDCGWRGMQFYPRSEWPSPTGLAPEGVDGWENGTAAFVEWQRHVVRALPELAVHDLAHKLAETEKQLRDATDTARRAGVPWSRIAALINSIPRTGVPCPRSAEVVRHEDPPSRDRVVNQTPPARSTRSARQWADFGLTTSQSRLAATETTVRPNDRDTVIGW